MELIEFLTPNARMEGKWWDIRKGYGLSQSNSYGEGVGRLFWVLKVTADDGVWGLMMGRRPTGSYGAGLTGDGLNVGQDFGDPTFFEGLRDSYAKAFAALPGYDPMDYEHTLIGLYSAGLNGSIADALLDAKCRRAGLPIHQMAAGTGRRKVMAYASSFCDMGTPDEYADHAWDCLQMGYRGYKIHTYRCLDPSTMRPAGRNTASPDWDVMVCEAVRRKVGDGMRLMLDPDGIYPTLEDAVRVGRRLTDLGFHWYEAPMNERDRPERYGDLRKAVGVPLCGPENVPGGYKARVEWHKNGWTDMLRPGGGYHDVLKTAGYAQAVGLRCEVHGGGYMAAHAIASFPEEVTGMYEQLLVQPGHSEFAVEDVDGLEPRVEGGFMEVPMRPGIGYNPELWGYAEDNALRRFTAEAP